jgi:quinol monooxygenase YgiN
MRVVVANIRPKPGTAEQVEAVLKAAIPRAQEEPGCEVYALHTAKDYFVMIEKWADVDALRAWGTSAKLQQLHDELEPFVESVGDFVVLRQVPVGDAQKGAI